MTELPKRTHIKPDGRYLHLYGDRPGDETPGPDLDPVAKPEPHLRWHPLRQAYVAYATHRQGRTFKPPKAYCPLCPSAAAGGNEPYPGEIPFSDFAVAVFENRFPGFHVDAGPPPEIAGVPTDRAAGRCEVVVYCSDHVGSLHELPNARRELLLDVWAERYRRLYEGDGLPYAMPFENRGEDVGVTLHHPHGQIYGFPFVPPRIQREVEAFQTGSPLAPMLADDSVYTVWSDAAALAAVPPYACYPYETWVMPRRPVPGPWALTAAERQSLARALGEAGARLDRLFDQPMPYIMSLHAAPRGCDASFHFHITFYPFRRSADKLKYLAGCEQAAGIFLVDMAPEAMAEALRHA